MHRMIGSLMWPQVPGLIVKGYKLDGTAIAESVAVLETEFTWLEERLSESAYLIGNTFTRADLTAASLLAPLARPGEMPIYRDAEFPDELAATLQEWQDRPIMNWVRQIYSDHRH